MGPARIGAPFEMIEPELGLEVLIMLFDRPAVMRQPDELFQGGRGRQRDEIMPAPARRPQATLAEQPDFWCQSPTPPVGGRGHAQGREIGGPWRVGPVAPRDPMPRPRLQAIEGGRDITGPSVFLCTQHSGKDLRAFTYKPLTG